MEYIILAAGVGTRLYPYTKNTPKCLVKVTENETVIERTIRLINQNDKDANITIVLGFQAQSIIKLTNDKCNYIFNPFYKVTNSIASLWFAKDILEKADDTVILNADIVFDEKLAKEICSKPQSSLIYYDSSIKSHGDYNVQVHNGTMTVMGKELSEYEGEYVGVTKFAAEEVNVILKEVVSMVSDELYDQWYENALVQMSLNKRHSFKVYDVADYHWSEIDSIDNLLKIRKIVD